MVGESRTPLVLTLASVGVVLLIACANIAGLLLARSAGRYRELGIRRALGAGRARLARLLFIESMLVATGGGVAGLLLAVWTRDVILALAPAALPRLNEVGFDARVILFAAGVSAATGVLFGLLPAWQFSKPDILGALKDARAASLPARQSVRSALVVAELALAMVLLTGAVLLGTELCARARRQPRRRRPRRADGAALAAAAKRSDCRALLHAPGTSAVLRRSAAPRA